MPRIFISYRREDSQWPARALRDALIPHVGDPRADIFMDIDNIPLGVNFAEHIGRQVAECDVLLALIGQAWFGLKNADGTRRLEDPRDFVRIEIAQALRRGIPVVPVLLDGATIPASEQLPEDLRELSMRNGTTVRHATFSADVARLVTGLGLLAGGAHEKAEGVAKKALAPIEDLKAAPNRTTRSSQSLSAVLEHVFPGHSSPVTGAAFSPNGSRLVTSCRDALARVWSAQSGQCLVVLSGHRDKISSAAFFPDGVRIVTASHDKTARVWDSLTGSVIAELTGHTNSVGSAAPSPDGTKVVTSSGDGTARVWCSENGSMIATISWHKEAVHGAGYSPDGEMIVTASADSTAAIWGTEREPLHVLRHAGVVASAEFSPKGDQIATASSDTTARIWDVRTGRSLTTLLGHSDRVLSAKFSPDGKRIVTASADKTARIWDVQSGRTLAVLSDHSDIVLHAEFSPDGKRACTASADMTARIWHMEE